MSWLFLQKQQELCRETFCTTIDILNTATFVGKGKLQEIKEYIANNEENKIDTIIFDDELSPRQIRNIEKELKIRILTELVLSLVFLPCEQNSSCQSTSRTSSISIFIAASNTHVDAPGASIRRRRCYYAWSGETQLETDKRIVLDKISD